MNIFSANQVIYARLVTALFATIALNVCIVASAAAPTPAKAGGSAPAPARATATSNAPATPQANANLTEATVEAKLVQMKALCQGGSRTELIAQFKDEDIAAWPNAFKDKSVGNGKAVDGLNLRGMGFYIVRDYARAEQDFALALKLSPNNGYLWNSLGDVYKTMKDDQKALDAYMKAYESDRAAHTAKSFGWMPLSATLEAASILISQTKYPEALKVMERYDDNDMQKMGAAWGCKMLRAYGQIYAAMGSEKEALIKYKAALELEKKEGK